MPYTAEEYEAAKAKDPEFYREADSLEYGHAPKIPEQNIDRMVAELNDQCAPPHCISDAVVTFEIVRLTFMSPLGSLTRSVLQSGMHALCSCASCVTQLRLCMSHVVGGSQCHDS